jgi:hypothetical protein
MFGYNPFAVPISSFQRPVPLVLVDPDDEPNYSVCFRSEWLPYILGALEQLLLQTTWRTDDIDALKQQQDRSRLLIEQFMLGCPTEMPTVGCVAFPMSASFISYYPQNPYTQPGLIPDWYSAVPFLRVDTSVLTDILGLADGDVVALPGAFPNPDAIVEKGLSAIHLDLVGSGQVELHFVEFPEGSLAIVTLDNDGLNSVVVDTNADVIELPGETPGEIIKEFTFETGGAHTIDIRFSPVLDDSGIPLRYGGGMRSVVLCGFDSISGDTMFDVRQNEALPCKLEKSTDGGTTWTQWANLKLCPPDLRIDRGGLQIKVGGVWVNIDITEGGTFDEKTDGAFDPPYPTGTVPSGQTGNCLAAENIVAFFASSLTQMRQGMELGLVSSTIISTVLAAAGGFMTPLLAAAAVSAVVTGAIALGIAGIDDLLTDDTLDKFKCAISCNIEADGSVTATEYNHILTDVASTIASTKAGIINDWLDGFGPVGLSRQGRAADILTGDCDGCGCLGHIMVTFEDGGYTDYDIVAGSITVGSHPPGDALDSGISGSAFVDCHVNVPDGATITAVSLDHWTDSSHSDATFVVAIQFYDATDTLISDAYDVGTPNQHGAWQTHGLTGLSATGVDYVRFVCGQAGYDDLHAAIDNLAIDYIG